MPSGFLGDDQQPAGNGGWLFGRETKVGLSKNT